MYGFLLSFFLIGRVEGNYFVNIENVEEMLYTGMFQNYKRRYYG